MKTWTRCAAALGLLALSGAVQAALIDRGGGLIYNTNLNVTYLADLNYAKTSGYAATGVAPGTLYDANAVWTDGRMGWHAALNWAHGLEYGGYDDWELVTWNQLGHLFATELGNRANESVFDQTGDTAEQVANMALFTNIQEGVYWIGLPHTNVDGVVTLLTAFGVWQFTDADDPSLAIAVRPGDIGVAVPEPETWVLSLLALAAAIAIPRRWRAA